ncbi:nickel/cobalt efflux transporter [Neisseriaceae bacterium TC5R-5]|nr:nickel/cobalt efflux transporter [Neisseriaceae bacterium TC5R-5]
MTDFSTLLQQGNAWLFIPSAILLGALHGLEPGHSKTMMAAFIVAVRGTVAQAVLLGLAATVSHTIIVWLIAMAGLYFGQTWSITANEPYLQLASAALIMMVAVWMIWRTWRDRQPATHHHDHDHDIHHTHHRHHDLDIVANDHQDAHERAHANDIRRRFANREVSTGQIVLFGLSGGLIPCPASITVLLLCLQLQKVALGATLVLSFSVGLALTMVTSGVLAALSIKHLSKRWSGFGEFARKAPYVSGVLIAMVACYIAYTGWIALP